VTVEQLERELAGPAPPRLLDARSSEEVAVSSIAGARRIEPNGAELADVPLDRPIVVYCAVGWRSAIVADDLAQRGAQDVRNLDGGIFAWANAGRPVQRDERIVREVHPFDRRWAFFLDDSLEAYAPREPRR
jgi:rhodanese-related sulfurtransferase